MTREEIISNLLYMKRSVKEDTIEDMTINEAIKALEQEPCEMTAEEYRQRMMQAFHNADCDELIALVVLPTEKEFEHLEWLLEKHYKAKPESCTDAISRNAVIEVLNKMDRYVADELTLCDTERKFPKNEVFIVDDVYERIVEQLPLVKLRQRTGE